MVDGKYMYSTCVVFTSNAPKLKLQLMKLIKILMISSISTSHVLFRSQELGCGNCTRVPAKTCESIS